MVENIHPTTILMKTKLTFSVCVLSLILCAGCQQTTTAPASSDTATTPAASSEKQESEGYVEPLVPTLPKPEQSTEQPTEQPKAETPKAPETSAVSADALGKFAAEAVLLPPIDDLTAQIDEFISKLDGDLESLDGSPKYKDDAASTVVRDASALSLVALAIGLADADSKYKKAAPSIIVAAKVLATAENLEAGQKAYQALKASLSSDKAGEPLSWTTKTADLAPLMKAVPNLSSSITRLNTEKKLKAQLKKKPEAIFGALAALSVIQQGSIANVKETAKPDAEAEWKKECELFRDAALKANAAAHDYAGGKIDFVAFSATVKTMTESCESCHHTFHPAASEKTNDDEK
jgi:hypothetical protein